MLTTPQTHDLAHSLRYSINQMRRELAALESMLTWIEKMNTDQPQPA